jgi:uncharacterized protein YcfJ
MKRVQAMAWCFVAALPCGVQARTPSENTSHGYAQVLRVEPVYQTRVVKTVDPDCLRPTGRPGVVKVPSDCRPRPVRVRAIVAYDVEYTYKGDTYMSRLDYDPGSRLRVRVSVTPDDGDRPREAVAPSETR